MKITKEKTIVGWDNIAKSLPTKPTVRHLMNHYKKFNLPIYKGKITKRVYMYESELAEWIRQNERD
jgi:hypothetical protein